MSNIFSLSVPAVWGQSGQLRRLATQPAGLFRLLTWLMLSGLALSVHAQSVCTSTNLVPLPDFTGSAYQPYKFYHLDGSAAPTFYRGETIYSYAVNTTGACRAPSGATYITPVMPAQATVLCTPIASPNYYIGVLTNGLYSVGSKICQKIGPTTYVYSQHQKFSIDTPGTYPVTFQNGNGTTLNLTIVSRVCVQTDCGNFGGAYEQTGMRNGKVDLFDPDGNELYFDNGAWQISSAGGIAFQVSSSADYPPTTGWQPVGACAGVAISVAEGNCPLPTYSIRATLTNICEFSGVYNQVGFLNGRPSLAGPNGAKLYFMPDAGWRLFAPGNISQTYNDQPLYGINSVAYEPPASGWIRTNSGGQYTCTTLPSVAVERVCSFSVSIAPSSQTITAGSSVTLTASGADSYTWSNGSIQNPLIVSNVTSATAFSVTGTTSGCSSTASAEVSVTQASNPCVFVPQNITVTGSGGFDGVYTPFGTQNGAPRWTLLENNFIVWNGEVSRWEIGDDEFTFAYVTTNSSINNLPCSGWTSIDNRFSAPTLSGGCGSLVGGPSVSIAPSSQTITSGSSVTLTASGADSYTWSNGVQSTSVVLTNVTSATTLSVTGTTGACSATASAAITVTACSLTTTISGRLDRCPGGTTSLTAVGPTGANYRWSSGENTAVISASLATQYSVTVTGTDNCTATATRQITTRALPTVSITPTPSLLVCPGTSVTLTATSGLSYSWSSGANTAFISFVPTSTTVLSVTASDGVCSSLPASVTVTVQPSVTATITPNPGLTICASAGGLLMASGAGQGGSYRWNTNANTAQITVNSSGPYTVTATSSAGCSGTATVSITALNPFPLAQPVLSASSSVVCEGGSASVTATVTGSVQTYQWYRNGISLGSAQSSSVLNGVSQAGSYVLVIGTSGCGSATSTAFTLTVNPLPTVTIAFPTSANVNPAGPVVTVPVGTGLSYQVFGGGSNARYERKIIIDRINGFELRTVLDNQTGIFPIDRAGPYTITVTDANGCSRTVTGEIVGR